MRCLRKITTEQLTATVFLSKENYDTLDAELNKNFNMDIKDMSKPSGEKSLRYKVRVLPPPRSVKLKRIWREYSLNELGYSSPIDFSIEGADFSKYTSIMYEKDSISHDMSVKETNIDHLKERMCYSAFSLAGEISRYLNISPVLAARIIRESKDGEAAVLEAVNKYNEILDDVVIPQIFHALFEVKSEVKSEDRELVLLKEPKEGGYYEFSGKPELVVTNADSQFKPTEVAKSFHADTYCFDSRPEKECFLQYVTSGKVKKVYFTGMFTSNQGDLSIQYYDPESRRIRQYYPDFFAEMTDGSYELIEVKGDDKIEDSVVIAKAEAAREMAVASGVEYKMYAGSVIMKTRILEADGAAYQATLLD